MKDEAKTKKQLIRELKELREQVGDLKHRLSLHNHKEKEPDDRFRQLAEQSPNMIFINQNGRVVYVNQKCEEVTGIKQEEFYSPDFDFFDLISTEYMDLVKANFEKHSSGQEISPYEYTFVGKDGRKHNVIINTKLIDYEKNTAILGIITDITDHKQSLQTLLEKEERYHALFDLSPSGIILEDRDGIIIDVNPAFCESLKYTREELVGSKVHILTHPDNVLEVDKNIKRLLSGELLCHVEKSVRKDGTICFMELNEKKITLPDGRAGILCIAEDFTERKLAEDGLKLRLEFEKIISGISSRFVGVFDFDEAINDTLLEIGSFSRAGRTYLFLFNADGAKMHNTHEWCAPGVSSQRGKLQNISCDVFPWWMEKLKKGEIIHVKDVDTLPEEARSEREILQAQGIKSLLVLPIYVKDSLTGFIGFDNVMEAGTWREEDFLALRIVSEIIGNSLERKRVEERLQEAYSQFSAIIENAPHIAIQGYGPSGNITFWNAASEKLYGYSKQEALGKRLGDFILSEEDAGNFEELVGDLLTTSKPAPVREWTALTAGGEKRWIISSIFPIKFGRNETQVICIDVDITERKKLEEELTKTEKLESLGVLAGGIAHDFNNLLTAILGNISLAKMYSRPGEKVFERLTEAEKASSFARDLTQQLLTFSKGGMPIKKSISIVDLIKDSASFALRGSNVKYDLHASNKLWAIKVDEGQISQVIHNIVINANQAMPGGGTISIRCRNFNRSQKDALPLPEGRYLKISIKDQGTGIPEEHLPKIFDPYFTTKQRGSGLGLATAFSIIKKHNGYIDVESTLNKGTIFHIYLPASSKTVSPQEKSTETVVTGAGKILLMDDEQMIREVASIMLSDLGYEVEFARDGKEAVEIYQKEKEKGTPFDLVIMDLTIPGGMGGVDAMKKLTQIDPEVKAVVSSGYSTDPVMANYHDYGFADVISKPYRVNELVEVLQRLIKESNDSPVAPGSRKTGKANNKRG